MPSMLIIDDDDASCRTLKLHFGTRGFDVRTANGADGGLEMLADRVADIVISDIHMPGRDGLSLLREIRERYPNIPVIMITAFHDMENTIAAMQGGATDYIAKPIDLEELETAIDRAVVVRDEETDDALELGSGDVRSTIIGRSYAMKEVFKSIGMVSQGRVTVMVLGESGTGKELVARAIHNASPERNQPFIPVNCAALVETLLESEMFGHERGAFTGAVSARKGKVAMAGRGTLFLDEVAELSPRMQGKLLRLLEEREYTPVGGGQLMTSEARFITATNVNLTERVAAGAFREDLYYRLNVVSISLPPLRERREDIPALVEYLLKKINKDIRKGVRRVSAEVMDALMAYTWPGNIRQLENALIKAVVMAPGDSLNDIQLPGILNSENRKPEPSATRGESPSPAQARSLRDLERDHIESVLQSTGWHKGQACDILGISRPRLERRIKEHGLEPDS